MNDSIQRAAQTIAQSDAILIGAGAGMGVDSGLPDFRGTEGFWKAYPPMKKLGLSFYDLANPVWFSKDPQRAWGFYGHRRNLYRQTNPHSGFSILKKWADDKPNGGFVFTSNVDGHFQKAGFAEDQILECHGSINFSQCSTPCENQIWPAEQQAIDVDLRTFKASVDLPQCQRCSSLARPNILMFGDSSWIDERTDKQYQFFEQWLNKQNQSKIAVVEIGAGTAVPTVRFQCEQIARRYDCELIRINPREAHGRGVISIETGGLEALQQIDRWL